MGYISHDAVIAVTHDCRPGGLPDIEAFRASLPEYLQPLVIGPIAAPLNGYVSYAFLPDGSKKGWDASNEAEQYRRRFSDLFETYADGTGSDDVAGVAFGGDHRSDHHHPIAYYVEKDLRA
ncbi:hypothetical protein ABT034_33745 [Streptomyces sp. NPDC002773]|uniref:hypothetical protein n=1 Tax=Streptomyces sp. NPDC002773 TaxID=3154430 RepID=UPI00331C3DC9